MLCAEKKRKSSKLTKTNDNDNDDTCVDNNKIDDNEPKEEDQSLQNRHSRVETENGEEEDVVSDLPVYGSLRKISCSKTPTGNNSN